MTRRCLVFLQFVAASAAAAGVGLNLNFELIWQKFSVCPACGAGSCFGFSPAVDHSALLKLIKFIGQSEFSRISNLF